MLRPKKGYYTWFTWLFNELRRLRPYGRLPPRCPEAPCQVNKRKAL